MDALLFFLCGLLSGVGICLLRLRADRLTLVRLEQLLPKYLQQESTSLPYRLKRWAQSSQDQYAVAQGQVNTYEAVLDQSPFGFLLVDQNNQLIFWNSRALDLLQIKDLDQFLQGDRLILELVRSYELDRLIAKTRRKQKTCKKNWVLKSVPQDVTAPILSEFSQSLRGYGVPLSAFQVGVFLEDLNQLDTLKQDRDRWMSDLAHEFKTPLTAIRLVAETLEPKVDASIKPWVVRLQAEVTRLNALVQDILDLSYGQSNAGAKTPKQKIDLAQQIHEVWMSLEPMAQKKDLSLFYDGPDSLPIQGDAPGLYRVLLNVLDNAVKHSPERETIYLKAQAFSSGDATDALSLHPALVTRMPEEFVPRKNWIQIDVMDMGAGIPQDALPHVFKRFFKVDQSRVRDPALLASQELQWPLEGLSQTQTIEIMDMGQSGTGLGLAIAKEIIVAHQGQIAVGKHPDWQGAWFQIRLPKTQKSSKKKIV